MREIKFRAWDTETKEMSYDFLDRNWLQVCIASPYVELMQYTGLKDKNGKEIYEGDILKISNLWRVYFNTEIAQYIMHRDSTGEGVALYEYCKYSEIIGNIYTNPDLLPKAFEPTESHNEMEAEG